MVQENNSKSISPHCFGLRKDWEMPLVSCRNINIIKFMVHFMQDYRTLLKFLLLHLCINCRRSLCKIDRSSTLAFLINEGFRLFFPQIPLFTFINFQENFPVLVYSIYIVMFEYSLTFIPFIDFITFAPHRRWFQPPCYQIGEST